MPNPLIELLKKSGLPTEAIKQNIKTAQHLVEAKPPTVDWPQVDAEEELQNLKQAVEEEDWNAAANAGNKIEDDLRYIDELVETLKAAKEAVQNKDAEAAPTAVDNLIDAYHNWKPGTPPLIEPGTLKTSQAPTQQQTLAKIEEISPVTLKDMPNEEVLSLHLRMHQLWGRNFAGNDKERAGQLVREDVWNAHQMIVEEMGRRDMNHDSPISVLSERLSSCEATAQRHKVPPRAMNATYDLPNRVTVVPSFVSIVGSTATQGPGQDDDRTSSDVDVLIRAEHDGENKFLIQDDNLYLPIRKVLDPEKEGRLHFIPNPQGPHAEYIPLFDLVLVRRGGRRDVQLSDLVLPRELASTQETPNLVSQTLRAHTQESCASGAITDDTRLIDLGCDRNKPEGYIGVDIRDWSDADVVHDLEDGLPFPDEYADVIRAYHVLEHLSDPIFIMGEIWRALKPEGVLIFEVPSTRGEGAFAHPDHKSFWNETSFAFYTQDHLIDEAGFPGKFSVVDLETYQTDDHHHYTTGTLQKVAPEPPAQLALAVSPWYTGPLPKPAMKFFTEFFSIDELWKQWAKKRIQDGLMVEEKLNGFRALVQKKGDQVHISLLDEKRTNVAGRFPELVEAIKHIDGDVILDGDIAVVEDGKRWPRVKLMTLASQEPSLPAGAHIVYTAFDILFYEGADLTPRPLSKRRPALERAARSADSDLLATSKAVQVSSHSGLEKAGRRLAHRDMSEGIVVKELNAPYPLSRSTSTWAKVKHVVEIKALVLKAKHNDNGTYNFRGGLLPGNSDFPNRTEYDDTEYVDLGFSFNAPFKAKAGDVVTFQVEEIILQENGDLAWLGAKPIDVDHDRGKPYTAPQVVDLAERGRILQDATDTRLAAVAPAAQSAGKQLPNHREAVAVMIAFRPDQELAEHLALDPSAVEAGDVLSPEELHMTLAYLGTADELPIDQETLQRIASDFARKAQPLHGEISGIGRFSLGAQGAHYAKGQHAIYASVDLPGLLTWRQTLAQLLTQAGAPPKQNHSFTPHITLAYVPEDAPSPIDSLPAITVDFDTIHVAWGDDDTAIRLQGDPGTITAGLRPAGQWAEASSAWAVRLRRTANASGGRAETAKVRFAHTQAPDNEGDTRGERATKFWAGHWHESFPKDGKGKFVYQHHWRGLSEDQSDWPERKLLDTDHSVHGDLRLSLGKALWGFTCFLGTTSEAKRRDLPNLPADDALEGKFKLHQPKAWLTIARDKPFVAEPGDIGSTSQKWSKFFEIDHGTYTIGVWHKHFLEIFLNGSKIDGRYLITYAPVGGSRKWLIRRPDDQTPFAKSHDKETVIKERRKKGDKYLVWAKPGQKPELINLEEAK